jgi:hypothetical protein
MSFRWDDHDPGDEDPGEFTAAWAKRWLTWTIAERIRSYIGTIPAERARVVRAEVQEFFAGLIGTKG